jgi:hypothetical protein
MPHNNLGASTTYIDNQAPRRALRQPAKHASVDQDRFLSTSNGRDVDAELIRRSNKGLRITRDAKGVGA